MDCWILSNGNEVNEAAQSKTYSPFLSNQLVQPSPSAGMEQS